MRHLSRYKTPDSTLLLGSFDSLPSIGTTDTNPRVRSTGLLLYLQLSSIRIQGNCETFQTKASSLYECHNLDRFDCCTCSTSAKYFPLFQQTHDNKLRNCPKPPSSICLPKRRSLWHLCGSQYLPQKSCLLGRIKDEPSRNGSFYDNWLSCGAIQQLQLGLYPSYQDAWLFGLPSVVALSTDFGVS